MSKLPDLINTTLIKTYAALERGTSMPRPKLRLLKSEALHRAEKRFPCVSRLEDLIQEVAAGVFLCHGCHELLPRGEKTCSQCKVEMMGDAGDLEPIA